ncbi:MAG: TetR/AcrR family transcriptional regulator [Planctomycetes bacterium]|nr:TetR/AcrR family transcriptional regulator [Planctomycetota bacterium]
MPEQIPTRERLIVAAMGLVRAQGYHATSMAQILKAAQANSGSLYYFFKTKKDLLLAVLDRYTELLWPTVIQPAFDRVSDPIERIFAILDGYRQMLLSTDFKLGCPIGDLALELGDSDPAAREKIALNFRNWCEAIERCLEDGAGSLPNGIDRAAMAQFILSVMEGGVMQARAHRSIEPFDACVAHMRDYFKRLGAEARGGPSRLDADTADRDAG